MCYVIKMILRVRVYFTSVSRLRATPVTRRIRRANSNWPPFEFAAGLHLDDGYRATRVPPLLSHLPTTARASTPPHRRFPTPSFSSLPLLPSSRSARFSQARVAVPHGKCRIPTKTGKLPSLACFSVGLLPPRGVRCYSFSSLRSRCFPFGSTERKEKKREDKKSLVEQQTYICPVHRYPYVTRSCSVLSSPSLLGFIFPVYRIDSPLRTFKLSPTGTRTQHSGLLPLPSTFLFFSSACSREIFARERRSRSHIDRGYTSTDIRRAKRMEEIRD